MRYRVPATEHSVEQEIKRSRFIATVVYAATSEQARAAIAAIAARHRDASHNCWAYQVGAGRNPELGASDDGEPAGTAGRPMLAVLRGSGVGDVAAVVTRYFGGVKLGTGGLVRAYSGTLQQALASLPLREHVVRRAGSVVLDYAQYEQARRLLAAHDAQIVHEEFGASITMQLALPLDRWDECAAALRLSLSVEVGG